MLTQFVLIITLIVSFYLYFEYIVLTEKFLLLQSQFTLLEKNTVFLTDTIQKQTLTAPYFNNVSLYICLFVGFSFVILILVLNYMDISKKMKLFQTHNLNIFEEILKKNDLLDLKLNNLSSQISEIIIQHDKTTQMLDFLTKGPSSHFVLNEAATNLSISLSNIFG